MSKCLSCLKHFKLTQKINVFPLTGILWNSYWEERHPGYTFWSNQMEKFMFKTLWWFRKNNIHAPADIFSNCVGVLERYLDIVCVF